MNRRHFTAAALLAGGLFAAPALADMDYTPGLVEERLGAGETVLLDFKASWCSTCRAQERVLDALKAANPAYEESITFINVDWDQYGDSDLSQELNIPRRSTLVLLRGEEELGRVVADVSQSGIQGLLDQGLATE